MALNRKILCESKLRRDHHASWQELRTRLVPQVVKAQAFNLGALAGPLEGMFEAVDADRKKRGCRAVPGWT